MHNPSNRVAELPRPSPEFPRRYLPTGLDFNDASALDALFRELTDRTIHGPAALEQWLLDVSETFAAISEERSRRYIAMTCATGDAEIEKAYLYFVEHIQPKWKTAGFELDRKLLACPESADLEPVRYEVLLRNARNEVDLFREENIPIETELNWLAQQYQKLCGAMTVEYQGKTLPLQQMAVYLQEPDRAVRQDAWERMTRRRLQDRDAMESLFETMIAKRHRMAQQAGFDNFRDYSFRRMGRFDYTPEDCETFHRAVEQIVVPAMRKLLTIRAQTMSLERLRPWDLGCDPLGRPPLKPFDTTDRMIRGCRRIFGRVHPTLGAHFDLLIDHGLLDLECRVGKAPGGYQSTLDESRMPFIFMNAVGLQRDVMTLLHEGGHAFHAVESRLEPLSAYRHAPIEFCEVASMSMELIGGGFLDEFYSSAEAARARRSQMEDVLILLPWIATIDAFQHWIYTHPGHTAQERADHWISLLERFGAGPIVDETGWEDARRFGWHKQLHLFQVPFYYIEYGIAQLGALQLWKTYRADPERAITGYRNALSLGGSRPLPDLFKAAGIRFEFGPLIIRPLIDDALGEAMHAARADAV